MSSEGSRSTGLAALSSDLAAAVERAARATVAVNARARLPSTGVHWRAGVIVAADHAVRLEEGITITDSQGRTLPAVLAGRDPSTDLAVLRVTAPELATAELGDPAALRVGHLVLAVGRGPSASWGIVSKAGGPWQTWRGGRIDRLLRLDLTLYPGFSGGPVADADGRILGIATSGLARHASIAIPATTVDRVAGDLLRAGRVARGYLGVGLQPIELPEDLRRRAPAAGVRGLIVVTIQPDGPAASAGMMIGDVLVALDGRPVGDMADVQAHVADRVGATVTATIVRGGEPRDLAVTVGERPHRT